MPAILDRPIIGPILEQHIENAAFCWARSHQRLWCPLSNQRVVQRYKNRLTANINGLRLSGNHALMPAVAKLQRWKTPDETFVAILVLLHNLDSQDATEAQHICENILIEKPSLIDGATAACLELNPQQLSEPQRQLLTHWWSSPVSVLRRVALSFALNSPHFSAADIIDAGISDADEEFKANLLAAIGEHGLHSLIPHCEDALSHANSACRFEASYSLSLLGYNDGLPLLRDSLPLLTGHALKRSLLLWATDSSDEEFHSWLTLPGDALQHQRSRLWALAFRGDQRLLECITPWLNPTTVRLAAHAITHITNIDLESVLAELAAKNDDGTTTKGDSDDAGLAAVDPDALRNWIIQHCSTITSTERHCMGLPISLENANASLAQGTQPQRWQAALYLSRQSSTHSGRHMVTLLNKRNI
ncbi:HEAT repeat domain-containing protein [Cellvibrio sp. UBA7661]|uniref:HEAT repeat domain-containing protein n=1 Tax=Cellvibrio sp. UBA7661 TaxID=1946311 RepID=UPI002F35CC99